MIITSALQFTKKGPVLKSVLLWLDTIVNGVICKDVSSVFILTCEWCYLYDDFRIVTDTNTDFRQIIVFCYYLDTKFKAA